jgi:hypothetical protein
LIYIRTFDYKLKRVPETKHIAADKISRKLLIVLDKQEEKTDSEIETDILNKIRRVYPVYINGRDSNKKELIKSLNTNPRPDNKEKTFKISR